MARVYDQIAAPIGRDMSNLARGSSVQVNALSDMQPGTSAISEVSDIAMQALRDATLSITPTSRGEGIQCSELLLNQAYTDYGAQRFGIVGKGLMESLEVLARDGAGQGRLVIRQGVAARTSLLASATGHRATDGLFSDASTMLETLKCPGFKGMGGGRRWVAIMHPAAFHDIREDGNVQNVGIYQDKGIILNYELGSIGPFALVSSAWAKGFGGAGGAFAMPRPPGLATPRMCSRSSSVDRCRWRRFTSLRLASTAPSLARSETAHSISGSRSASSGTGTTAG